MGRKRTEPLRVLVVDDEPQVADTLALVLRGRGYDVRVAYEGWEAVWAAEEFRPRVVLLDLAMPQLHGYDVARLLRNQAGLQGALLVAVTGHADEQSRRRAAEAGFNDYLAKPVGWQELEPLLSAVPGRSLG